MPNPFKRHSHARSRKRRSHDFLENPAASTCSNCGEPKKPHIVCPNCGYYRGRKVLQVEKE